MKEMEKDDLRKSKGKSKIKVFQTPFQSNNFQYTFCTLKGKYTPIDFFK